MIDLETAYLIRAEAIAFINNAGGVAALPTSAVAAEMQRLHPELTVGKAAYLAERVVAHWGQTGLDYEEAPMRADGVRKWYPVRRNGRLRRIAVKYLTAEELAGISSELKRQDEELLAHTGELWRGEADGPP